ncbi:O-antigen ligase family protein [Maribacter dokdonensis]|uniref:O-antigen ligase family protein n=1 Tax=Maribacter dokdonensis TaxID=320912 RepID=UPI001C08ACD5|nr:O-antigen ligase family protein [Maribacter dokdonensis]MBU2900553.1 O-antigen ligase family protein [Maribacter dokdonensis]
MNVEVFFEKILKFRFKILYILLCIPLLPYGVVSISIILYLFLSLAFLIKNVKFYQKSDVKEVIIQISYVVLLWMSIFYSNTDVGLTQITRTIPLLFFPIIQLSPDSINKKDLNNYLFVFVLSTVMFCIIFSGFLLNQYGFEYVFNGSIVYHVIKSDKFFLDVHPIYSSLYIIVASLICLNKILLNKYVFLYSSFLIILFLSLVVLASKAGIVCYFFSMLISLIINYKILKKYKYYIVVVLLSFLFLTFQSVTVINKFKAFFIFFNNDDLSLINSNTIRFELIKCWYKLFKDNLIFGYGIGDVQSVFEKCLSEKSITEISGIHNNYFRLSLSGGIIVLVLFIYSMRSFIKQLGFVKPVIPIFFTFLFLMFFEDILFRSYGICFFAILIHLYQLYKKYNILHE